MSDYLIAITFFFVVGAPDKTPLIPYVLTSLVLIGMSTWAARSWMRRKI